MQNVEFPAVLLLIGAVQGIFLGFVVLLKKQPGRSFASVALAGIIFVISFLLLFATLFLVKKVFAFKVMFPFVFPMFLLIGPFIYLYALTVENPSYRPKPLFLLNFLPYIFFVLFFSYRILARGLTTPPQFEVLMGGTLPLGIKLFMVIDFLMRLAYTTVSFSVVLRNKKNEKFAAEKSFDWKLLIILLSVSSFTLLVYLIILIFSLGLEIRFLLGIFFSVLIYLLGYYYIKEKSFSHSKAGRKESKYARSGLSEKRKRELYLALVDLMEKEKHYLNPELSAGFLADKLNISQNHLSQVLNEAVGKNFYEFVNYYRIREAKKLLENVENNSSILSIAYDVGFNSKTTFNIAFKKIAKMSPSEYRKNFLQKNN